MKRQKSLLSILISFVLLSTMNSCISDFLDYLPKDKITSATFPENEDDIKMLLNGVYTLLGDSLIFDEGLYGFGFLDGCTPNAYVWGNLVATKIGNGTLTPGDEGTLTYRWTRSYTIIHRANNLLSSIEKVELSDEAKAIYIGEAHFLRGLAYAILVETYGGVPIIGQSVTIDEARKLVRSTAEETWKQVHDDYDIAIANLKADAPEVGRATKGAVLGMKMRAYLYQGEYKNVLETIEKIDALGKYSLFPSYEDLFNAENENNQEVLFDIQYMEGENSQGSYLDQYCGVGTGSWTRGSRYVPTDHLVNAYETVDGSVVDPEKPYENRDPRLGFTIVLPGSYILGSQFPNYLYPGGSFNHPGCRIKHLACRKYRVQEETALPVSGQSYINYIVLRYADVLLSKAEALIETNGDINEAIALINRIRTERNDVKISPLPSGLSKEEAREKLRKERRIEFAMEGLYWSDIKRWNIGKDIYPVEIYDHNGGLVETKFPNGYPEYYNLLPIPDKERSLNENMKQNPGW
ncbi:MAG: RagB/SusD family nutrient uptake outer membrane protein [Prevotella sp.]|nr:RagB/SusD family nutrient uptake outer membrane protein [Prevotella sp.]